MSGFGGDLNKMKTQVSWVSKEWNFTQEKLRVQSPGYEKNRINVAVVIFEKLFCVIISNGLKYYKYRSHYIISIGLNDLETLFRDMTGLIEHVE